MCSDQDDREKWQQRRRCATARWGIGSCNINNQKVSLALKALETRPTTLCMQEARAPIETEVMMSHGDTAFMLSSERKEPKPAIAIRKDLAEQATVNVLEMKRCINHIEIITEGASIQINDVYLPHPTSKEWVEECLQTLTPVAHRPRIC